MSIWLGGMYQAFLLQRSYFFHYKSIVILYLWLYLFCEEVFSNSVNIPNFITFCLYIKTINSHWYLKFQFNTTEVVPFSLFHTCSSILCLIEEAWLSLSSVWISFNQITQYTNHLYHFSYLGLASWPYLALILRLCRLLHG